MDFVTRLKQYIEYTGLAVSQFADTAQIPRPTLSQILNGRNKKVSNELIAKLHEGFPRLNIMWMLFGDGTMEISDNNADAGTPRQNRIFSPEISSDAPQAEEFDESTPYGRERDLFSSANSEPESGLPDASGFSQRQNFRDSDKYGRSAANGRERTGKDNTTAGPSSSRQAERFGGDVPSLNLNPSMAINPDSTKKVQSIMVFYTDNSFEIFTPSRQS